ncbi:MAG: hypothetical protein IPP35_12205 [Elusimicrobia bacterium]|nr:hypothetical protein [Elusimicrobiota bacterium]
MSHNDSIDDPFLDAGINYLGHLNVLENLRHVNPTPSFCTRDRGYSSGGSKIFRWMKTIPSTPAPPTH